MGALVADTHAIIWYFLKSPKLSSNARRAMDEALAEGDPIYVSSITPVETIYLVEKGKLPGWTFQLLDDAFTGGREGIREAPVTLAVAREVRRVPREAVPDMPDRIIAATALHLRLPLVTRDQQIRATGIDTIW